MRRAAVILLVLAAGALVPAASTTALAAPAALAAVAASAVRAAPAARAGVGPAQPSIGVRLLEEPASEKNNPRARIYIIDFLHPGAVIHRHIQVTNYSGLRQRIVLYAGAASIRNGIFNVAAGATPNDLTTWIRLRPRAVSLPPRASATIKVTIAVPHDASPGERYAGIWAQTAIASLQQGHRHHRSHGVIEVSRVGIRVYLAVGKGGPPAPNFVIRSLTARRLDNGQPVVAAQVDNTGGRALDLSGQLALTKGPGALSAGPFAARLGTTIAPGQSELVTIPLNRRLPSGPWAALIRLTSGLTNRSARATITFPTGAGSRTFAARAILGAGGRYLIGTIIGALAVLAGLAFIILRRNRQTIRTRTGSFARPTGGK